MTIKKRSSYYYFTSFDLKGSEIYCLIEDVFIIIFILQNYGSK
nr:MAG TPA: hypothetical protein [Caudoviricetes sp.]